MLLAAGVKAGRRPHGGLGLDAGETARSSWRWERASCRGVSFGPAQPELVVDRAEHADRGVLPVAVVLMRVILSMPGL